MDKTTEQIMYETFAGDNGLRTAGGLAMLGKLFLAQPLMGNDDLVRHNLVKQFLHQAGFTLRLVRESKPREPLQPMDEDLDTFLSSKEGVQQ